MEQVEKAEAVGTDELEELLAKLKAKNSDVDKLTK